MLAGFITRSSRYRYTLLGSKSPTGARKRVSLLVCGLIAAVCIGSVAVWTFVDINALSIWPPPSLDDSPLSYQDPPAPATANLTSSPTEPESHEPPPLLDSHIDALPPLFSQYHERELRLPQQDWNRAAPAEHEKYFNVPGFRIGMFMLVCASPCGCSDLAWYRCWLGKRLSRTSPKRIFNV